MISLKINNYAVIEKIPFSEIDKIDFAKCNNKRETLSSFYDRQIKKPYFIINGGFFDMKSGESIFNYKDEYEEISKVDSLKYGIGITNAGKLQYGNIDSINYKDFISGYPNLIENGEKCIINNANEINGKHPRTAIGYNKDYLFLMTVDGRQIGKYGATFQEMQDWFLSVKCQYAIALDGGGSTRKLTNGKLSNSATENRPVSNVIAVYLKNGGNVVPKVFISPSTQEHNGNPDYEYIEEIEMNLIGDIVVEELNRCGVSTMRNSPVKSMREAVEQSNRYSPDIHLAIHSNAHGNNVPDKSKTARGALVYIYKKGFNAEKYAKSIIFEFDKIQRFSNRGNNKICENQKLYEVKATNAPAVIVEVDFHDNEGAKWIQDNRKNIADALVKSTLNYFGMKYIEKNDKPTEPTHWYDECRAWAIHNKIADGTRAEDIATRAEVWQMLYNYKKNI